jgi:hypothetical protein
LCRCKEVAWETLKQLFFLGPDSVRLWMGASGQAAASAGESVSFLHHHGLSTGWYFCVLCGPDLGTAWRSAFGQASPGHQQLGRMFAPGQKWKHRALRPFLKRRYCHIPLHPLMLPFLISFVPRRKSMMTLAFPEQKLLCIMAAFSRFRAAKRSFVNAQVRVLTLLFCVSFLWALAKMRPRFWGRFPAPILGPCET